MEITLEDELELRYLEKIIKGYKGARIHPGKSRKIYDLSKIHESISSTAIFNKMSKMIAEHQIPEFIDATNLKFSPLMKN